MAELNLLDSAPKAVRITQQGYRKEENKIIAKRYDKEFFDGDRVNGYGGYYYDGRWKNVVKKLQEVYKIDSTSSVLDIGCAKGFLLFDLQDMLPGIRVAGLDISEYALNKAMDGYSGYLMKNNLATPETAAELENQARRKVLPFMLQLNAEKLPWPDNSFDTVLAINTIHNLSLEKCKNSIKEMMRICRNKKNIFIQVDAYSDEKEKASMDNWILTAETFLSKDEWIKLFKELGYEGDYFWTIF
jgi:ubiquinone/menaquinone biosynthesis C-methylase UbiE